MQPGPFFLGQLRSGRDAFFGTAGAAASRRDSAFAGRGHARSVLAGSEQRWVLARQRRCRTDFLFLRVSGAGRFRGGESLPDSASYNKQLREWMLPYDAVRNSSSPDEVLLEFAQSTYDAASSLGKWDRAALVNRNRALHSTRSARN